MGRSTRWIIGRGLLGSAVSAARSDRPYRAPIDWHSPASATTDLARGLEGLLAAERGEIEIYWCAGKGVTSTPKAQLDAEADVFEAFLGALARAARGRIVRFFLASSVGGAYAGADDPPFTERTVPRPLSAYGETKLRMEAALARTAGEIGMSAFIARITNLYGPGQDLGKGQGLISIILESYVSGRPATIYVSLDTLRDYIYVDDCARVIDAAMTRLADEPAGTTVVKIVGAMNAVSVGAVLGEVSRLRRKTVPIVVGQGAAAGQAGDLRVRSVVWRDLDDLVGTTLPEGLGAVYRSQLRMRMLPEG